jgi:hypothetical protein
MVALLCACSREEPKPANVTPEIATLASDALHAASQIKVSGNIEAVLREHPLAPRYVDAMRKHFEMMRMLHGVGLQSHLRYPLCVAGAPRSVLSGRCHRESRGDHDGALRHGTHPTRRRRAAVHRGWGGARLPLRATRRRLDDVEMHQEELVARLRNPCGI